MRRTLIGIAAMTAAAGAGGFAHGRASAAQFMQLYDYGHARKWPEPDTLARKMAEICGTGRPPWPSLAEGPDAIRATFGTFRAVGAALEPFYADDPAGEPTYDEILFPPAPEPEANQIEMAVEAAIAELELDDLQQLIDLAKIGRTQGALEFVDANIQRLEKQIEAGEPDMDKDGVEERTRAAQAAMDAETAKHQLGGENVEADRQADDGQDAAVAEEAAPAAAAVDVRLPTPRPPVRKRK